MPIFKIHFLGVFSRKWKKIANFPLLTIVNVIVNVLGNLLLTFAISEIPTQFLETVQTNLKNGFVKRSDFSKLKSFLLQQETPPEKIVILIVFMLSWCHVCIRIALKMLTRCLRDQISQNCSKQISKMTLWSNLISQNCTKQISKMTSWNNLISQNCPSKSKKWLYEMIPFLKIFKIPACEMIRFLKIVAFSLCLVVSFSKLHQQISKMALWNNPISQNFQNSSLLSLSKMTEKDPF